MNNVVHIKAELDGWQEKLEKSDTNGEGVLIWEEAMVVRAWP